MTELGVELVLDILLLGVLSIALFYAVKLYSSLNAFKTYRDEFQGVIKTLSSNIEQAYSAVENLKSASSQAAEGLEDTLSDAKYMIDELRLINEASDNLAHRLEKLAQQGRQSVSGGSALEDSLSQLSEATSSLDDGDDGQDWGDDMGHDIPDVSPVSQYKESPKKAVPWQSTLSVKMKNETKKSAMKKPMFSIRDPDYDGSDDEEIEIEKPHFSSQAEQELYEALNSKK